MHLPVAVFARLLLKVRPSSHPQMQGRSTSLGAWGTYLIHPMATCEKAVRNAYSLARHVLLQVVCGRRRQDNSAFDSMDSPAKSNCSSIPKKVKGLSSLRS